MEVKVKVNFDSLPDGAELHVNDIGNFVNGRTSTVTLTKEQVALLKNSAGFEVSQARGKGGDD